MNDHGHFTLEIKLPQPDLREIARQLEGISSVIVDLRESEGNYSHYHGKLITIEHYILFPITISFPSLDAAKILSEIKIIIDRYLSGNETAIAIKDKDGDQVIIQGPMDSSTRQGLFEPLMRALIG